MVRALLQKEYLIYLPFFPKESNMKRYNKMLSDRRKNECVIHTHTPSAQQD